MKRKIFISINIPERIKKRLIKTAEKWKDLPVKWVREENLHVTLFFLGYIDDQTMTKTCQLVRETVSGEDIFDLEFDRIELAPDQKDPKMIWLSGNPSEELLALYEKIEKKLGIFTASKKSFRPHITLGRIRKRKWQELETSPEISEKISMGLTVESIDIMASDFQDEEREYVIIESCPLR